MTAYVAQTAQRFNWSEKTTQIVFDYYQQGGFKTVAETVDAAPAKPTNGSSGGVVLSSGDSKIVNPQTGEPFKKSALADAFKKANPDTYDITDTPAGDYLAKDTGGNISRGINDLKAFSRRPSQIRVRRDHARMGWGWRASRAYRVDRTIG